MQRDIEQRTQYDEPFKQAAAHFLYHSGRSLEEVSTELGLSPGDLRTWKRKYPPAQPQKSSGPRTRHCATNSSICERSGMFSKPPWAS
jgi:transposase-like protein